MLTMISEILRNRRLSLFGHVARLDPEVPANKALMVNSHESRKPSSSWTRPPDRPRRTWLNLVQEDANAIPLSSLWRTEIFRGHGAAQRSVRTTRWWWWWRWSETAAVGVDVGCGQTAREITYVEQDHAGIKKRALSVCNRCASETAANVDLVCALGEMTVVSAWLQHRL